MKNRNVQLGIKSKRKNNFSSCYIEDMPLFLFQRLSELGEPPYIIKVIGGAVREGGDTYSLAVLVSSTIETEIVLFPVGYLRYLYSGKAFISKTHGVYLLEEIKILHLT